MRSAWLLVIRHAHKLVANPLYLVIQKGVVTFGNFDA